MSRFNFNLRNGLLAVTATALAATFSTPVLAAEPVDLDDLLNQVSQGRVKDAEEAQARGHELFFYTPAHLAYQEGRITARGHDLRRDRHRQPHRDEPGVHCPDQRAGPQERRKAEGVLPPVCG